MTTWLSPAERTAWLAYLRATQTVEQAIGGHLRSVGKMTHPEYEILARLSAMPGHRIRVRDLAAALVSPRSRLSNQLDRLQRRGYLRREAHAARTRGTDAVLTAAGQAFLDTVAAEHVDTVRAALIDRLTAAEFQTLGRLLAKVAPY